MSGTVTLKNKYGTTTYTATFPLIQEGITLKVQPIVVSVPFKIPDKTPASYSVPRAKTSLSLRLRGRCDRATRDTLLKLAEQYVYVLVTIDSDTYFAADTEFAITGLDIQETTEYTDKPYIVTLQLERVYPQP